MKVIIRVIVIGERSKPPSDKLGGEIFISPRACLYVCHYIFGYVRPDNEYHAHSHCVRTLTLIPDVAQRPQRII